MKNVIFSFFLILFIINSCNILNAQQWSVEQKEVWSGIEKYWEISSSGDAKTFMTYFDDSYMGWAYQSKVPQSKASTSKWIENDLKNNSNVVYSISPLSIWVNGNFAYAHYYYAQIDKNKETGKTERSEGNWTDILMKKDGKWILVGDHGGRTSKPQ